MAASLLAASPAAVVASDTVSKISKMRRTGGGTVRHSNTVAARFSVAAIPAALRSSLASPRVSAHAGDDTKKTARTTTSVVRASISAPPDAQRDTVAAPSSGDQFDWFKAWYPMSPLPFLDPDVPNPMKVLGKSIVAWKAEDGAWKVVEDSCPHRMAPLSLGFINEERQLVCRYHGWEFNGEGKATAIPMSIDSKAEVTACESPRSCAKSYPVKEEAGVLWVWPTSGADAWLEASAAPVATAAAEFGELPGEWGMVELPVGYAPALENQFDPSHAEWLHARYNEDDGQLSASNVAHAPMTRFNVVEGSVSARGFTVQHGE